MNDIESEKFLDFILKKEILVKKISLFNDSKYFSFTNKIQFSGSSEAEALVSFLHESIHYYLNNLALSDVGIDLANLFNYLKYFYLLKKAEIFAKKEKISEIKDPIKQIQYVMAYTSELDQLLAKEPGFVDFCKFCINIYDIYFELQNANNLFNEGLATYYCINATPNCFLFPFMNIPDIFKLAVSRRLTYDDIFKQQNQLRKQVTLKENDIQNMDLYEFGYKYTDFLSETYGDNYLILVLLRLISSDLNIYDYDLLKCDSVERHKLIHDKFSYDTMFLNLLFKIDKIMPILLKERMNSYKSKKLFSIITNHLPPQNKMSDNELFATLFKNFFNHSCVIQEIEKLMNRKLSNVDIVNAFQFSQLQRIGKADESLFEHNQFIPLKNNDLLEIFKGHSICITKADKYAEEQFVSTYYGMKEIVKLAEGEL